MAAFSLSILIAVDCEPIASISFKASACSPVKILPSAHSFESAGKEGRYRTPLDLEVPLLDSEDEEIDSDQDWRHIIHCAPCYQEYLDVRAACRLREHGRPVAHDDQSS